MSLVFLTVLAGIGQGIFILLISLQLFLSNKLSPGFVYSNLIVCILLQYAGGVSSIFHLGNPQRAWKAIRMWRQSWLSREAITLGAFTGIVHLYLFLFYFQNVSSLFSSLLPYIGILGIIAALGFFLSSSMLYAAIRFIKEWANAFTPINFTLSGLVGGTAICFMLLSLIHPELFAVSVINHLLIGLTLIALVVKLLTYQYNLNIYEPLNLKHALGRNDSNIRQMDMGTPYEHFNTKEFHYPLQERQEKSQKGLVIVLAYGFPLLVWIILDIVSIFSGLTSVIVFSMNVTACGCMIIGLIFERRLFFIQGNHLQNLYYGNFKKNTVKNPLLSTARKGTPVP